MQSDKNNGASLAEIGLWTTSVVMLINSKIYGIFNSDTSGWFFRISIGVVSFGFAGVIREIRKLKE